MAKEISAPLARTARLLDLVPFLYSHQGVSIKELAKAFEVTPAQISADLTTLWMCGLPGYTPLELMDLEFESGYVSIRNATTLAKPRTITFDEGLALLLGLYLLKSSLPSDRADLADIAEALATRIAQKVGLPSAFQVSAQISPEIGFTIAKAIKSSDALAIQYHSLYTDSISMRTVVPNEIYHDGGKSYLKAFCFMANDSRIFRVDRILKAELTPVTKSMDLPIPETAKINFTIKILKASRDLVERFSIEDGGTSQPFTLTSYSQQWIARSILAAGASAQLIAPTEIAAQIAVKAQLMLDRYQVR